MDGAYVVSLVGSVARRPVTDHGWVSAEDRDLHSDLVRAQREIARLSEVIARQAEMLSAVLDRRKTERRMEPSGLAGLDGLDRRSGERRGRDS